MKLSTLSGTAFPRVVYNSHHTPITLGKVLGRGGEAVIYLVQGQPDLLAKLYIKSREGYEQKLLRMLANPPTDPAQPHYISIAWVRDLLYEADGKFAGLLIPHIHQAVKLLEVFTPQLRAQTLPNFNWQYLHRAAHNLAMALEAVHAHGYVVGDLNESNILVTSQALVTLIDTDSFQVQEQHQSSIITYPCPVGKGEYTPPELQNISFQKTIRLSEHDLFGMGVLIFQLLMEGNHPFRSLWRGTGNQPNLQDKIIRGLFPHTKPPNSTVAPPPDAPKLEVLHPDVAALVRRCFVDGHQDPRKRPTAQEWKSVLARAEQQLVDCWKGHYFSGHLTNCPQCGATRRLRGWKRVWGVVGEVVSTIVIIIVGIFLLLVVIAMVDQHAKNQATQATATAHAAQATVTAIAQALQTAATARAAQATVTTIDQKGMLIYGPESGQIQDEEDAYLECKSTSVNVSNFIAEIQFSNPAGADENWTYGLTFRNTGASEQYRLFFQSDHDWHFEFWDGKYGSGESGKVEILNTSSTGTNRLRLIVDGDTAFLFVNGTYITTLDVEKKQTAGWINACVGFIAGDEKNGRSTAYNEFQIWEIP